MFLALHLPYLPHTLEDIDSINFALGIHHFDVARHQPHPPGYPVFIALGKVTTPLVRRLSAEGAEARAMGLLSTLSGTALVGLLFVLFRALHRHTAAGGGGPGSFGDRRAAWATLIVVASPLFWFTAMRPLSDMTGLAAAIAAQALILSVLNGWRGRGALIAGALIAGVAIGVRSQNFLLTLPLLGLALVVPHPTLRLRDRVAAAAAAGLGVLLWGIPMIHASGGLEAYAAALGTQAGEDFSGVVMLWNARSPRVAVDALVYTLLWPWGGVVIGGLVIAAAAAGAARTAWRFPHTLLLLVLGFVPYAVFHLLFHEVVTVRYALPLLVPVAYFAALALEAAPRWALPAGAVALAGVSLLLTVPATVSYAREGSPTFAAFRALEPSRGQVPAAHPPLAAVGMHAGARRVAQWERDALPVPVLDAPHGREWLALVEQWRASPLSSVVFVADPRRTDLVLIDPASRRLESAYRWPFLQPPFVGGARPGNSDLYWMRPPQWMLDRGWALSAEVAGVTARDGLGPHRAPSIAWVRAGADEALLILGGRNLGAAGGTARISVTLGGSLLTSFDTGPGFFFRRVPLPAGALAGPGGYLPLAVAAQGAAGGPAPPVALEQFDLQRDGAAMVGAMEGWYEPEFNPQTARAWRWASDRAALWVRPVGRDVTLVLEGESPLRYFDAAPTVVVTAGSRELARFTPSTDFRQSIVLPAEALAAVDGRIVIASDRSFAPADRDGTADQRRLALRIYSYSVR